MESAAPRAPSPLPARPTTPTPASSSANNDNDDGTVQCPYCETELPPDLLLQQQGPRPPVFVKPKPGALARVDTSVKASQSEASPGMLAPPRSAVSAVRPQITTASLKHSLDESEEAENSATSAIISSDDIRRWSQIANIVFVPPPSPIGSDKALRSAVSAAVSTNSSAAPSPARAIPLIPPPPTSSGKPSPAGSGRFGFFSRQKSKLGMNDNEESDDELGSASGYSQLAGPGSDEEDDGYESDKPFSPKEKEVAEVKAEDTDVKNSDAMDTDAQPAPTIDTTGPSIPTVNIAHSMTPETPVDQLRSILGEVLNRVQLLSSSHTDLLSSHTTLLTSLKIARSNLVMAEANTEMLEDELKRMKVPSQPGSARSGTMPDAPRGSLEKTKEGSRPRPSSVHMSSGTSTPTPQPARTNSSGFGFWGKKGTTSPPGPSSPTEASTRIGHASHSSADMREEEVRILRAQIEHQSDELEALKKGKKAIESELEGLSQALFEEANKMVSDERKRRAELEESLREVRDEREALRQTVKVLGGRVQTPVPEANMPDGQASGNETLDEHYAALRRGIHHAVDGPSPAPSDDDRSDSGDNETEGRNRSNTVTTLKANSNGNLAAPSLEAGFPRKTSIDAGPNPWG